MKLYKLEKNQSLPIPVHQAWEFLSCPKNLGKIAPPYMGFEILGGAEPEKMFSGQIISYIVKPLAGIPIKWVTEITHVQEPNYFVDEQRFGPYTFWHHKHFIKEIPGGTQMRDLIHYALPLGPLGRLGNKLFVRKRLENIFEFRRNKLEQLFGKM